MTLLTGVRNVRQLGKQMNYETVQISAVALFGVEVCAGYLMGS